MARATGDEPNRVGRPSQYGGVTVGQSPKHIVANLAAKREFLAALHQRAGVIFQILALFGERIEIQMQTTCNRRH